MAAATPGALVDEYVIEIFKKAQLTDFLNKFVFILNVRRFEHLSRIRDKDMMEIGMNPQQISVLREHKIKLERELYNRSEPKPVYIKNTESTASTSEIDGRTLIPAEQINLYEKIGEGTFAVVKRGIWTQNDGRTVDVAVKILRDVSPMMLEDLRVEASHALKLQHPSLIRLYGIVRNPAMMVFELCKGGSLLDRLRDDKKKVLLVSTLLDYAVQIAKALQFLESKHCVHRDVAARNVLISHDEKTVKLGDFGLMRALKDNEQMYTMAPQKKVPFAWCPPESLKHRKFSHASDVWSYGVALWEIFTYGEEPWAGCRAVDVLKNIQEGERLEKPKYCSEKIYKIMLNCWKDAPNDRCKFSTIREDLKEAHFLNAVVREPHRSTQTGYLNLNRNDEVIVIENRDFDWFGQNKSNQLFGLFPRNCVFVQSNNAALPTVVTPQKPMPIPSITTTAPKILHSGTNVGNSRISMPIQGSFIHTGHGDPLGGPSWGSPSEIDDVYLKNPVKGAPLSSKPSGAELINSKSQIVNGRSTSLERSNTSAQRVDGVERLNVLIPQPLPRPVPKQPIEPKSIIAPTNNGIMNVPLPDHFSSRSQPKSSSISNGFENVVATQPAQPSKKVEPPLSLSVLQPIRLPTADIVVKNTTATPPHSSSPPNSVQKNIKQIDMPVQTQVPLFNITNSHVYPSLQTFSYQNYNNAYPISYSAYNPYAMQPMSGTYGFRPEIMLPPLQASQNPPQIPTAKLDESDIQELLGVPSRSSPPTTSSSGVTMSEKMEILYSEAQFTKRENCDEMVSICRGDTDLALKRLKENHLVKLHYAGNTDIARSALEKCHYDLDRAANILLG
ncbi:unnamed protein product [Caenorhabditis bovis]|uniref:non-specific protein-tyrosine kinase n=1 Tax=Caenorhabditis bovis TaxID=2654633 RepID=A0A8S1EM88_9PELO|nr:unnamed protein product [Caenorhabditis bovis]